MIYFFIKKREASVGDSFDLYKVGLLIIHSFEEYRATLKLVLLLDKAINLKANENIIYSRFYYTKRTEIRVTEDQTLE